MQHAARVAHVRQGRLDQRSAVRLLARVGRADVAGIDAGIDQKLEVRGHALRRGTRRRRRRLLARHHLGPRHVAADARPQRDRAAFLGDAAAREGQAAGHLQRLAARLERRADPAGVEKLDGDADGHGEGGIGAAVGGATGHQAERVVGEGERGTTMHAADIVAVPGLGRQHAMHAARLARVACNAEIERADMILEGIGRHEHRIAAKIDGKGVRHPGLALVKRRRRALIDEIPA